MSAGRAVDVKGRASKRSDNTGRMGVNGFKEVRIKGDRGWGSNNFRHPSYSYYPRDCCYLRVSRGPSYPRASGYSSCPRNSRHSGCSRTPSFPRKQPPKPFFVKPSHARGRAFSSC